jgi:hypothetical protein
MKKSVSVLVDECAKRARFDRYLFLWAAGAGWLFLAFNASNIIGVAMIVLSLAFIIDKRYWDLKSVVIEHGKK